MRVETLERDTAYDKKYADEHNKLKKENFDRNAAYN